jgi:hypothetical protein
MAFNNRILLTITHHHTISPLKPDSLTTLYQITLPAPNIITIMLAELNHINHPIIPTKTVKEVVIPFSAARFVCLL